MKRLLIILMIIIGIFLAAALVLPMIFKDEIKAQIDKALAESVNADIVWEADDFGLSFFSNFPNITASLDNFGIINRAPFEGQILFAVEEFEIEVGLFSMLGEQINIEGIEMNRPEIFIKVLPDGTANYDIAVEEEGDTLTTEADTAATEFNVGIDHWEITNGHLVYDDQSIPFKLELKNLEHSGSGDFTQDIFDLTTSSQADSVTIAFDGTEYVSNKKVEIDAILTISDDYSRYTFKDNSFRINDFAMNFEGYLALLEDGSMDMDIRYGTRENTFKSLLSLVPGIYTKDFKDIKSEGNLIFNGSVKGKYDSLSLPAFNLALRVKDAMFKYPDVPAAVENISMDLLVDNKDGNIDNTVVNLKQFHMDFGKNPVDARLLIKNLYNYDMDADIKGSLDLGDLSSMFPMEGMSMRGAFDIKLKASGIYDSVKQVIPKIEGYATLKDGYVKSNEFPYAIEKVNFDAKVEDPTGKMSDFVATIENFSMMMDGESFNADLTLSNLDNYTWDLAARGGVDLEKLTKVFPLEGMTMSGKIKADFQTAGKMSDLEAGRYGKLPASGTLTVSDFKYTDQELPYDVTIATAKVTFDPRQMTLNHYQGTVGKSDMTINGSITNYVGYVLSDKETIKGMMNFKSDLLDLNEFMAEEETPTVEEEEAEGYGVIKVPENIDFVLRSQIKTVKLMDMEITDARGDIIVKDGTVNLSGLEFGLLGGQFAVNGLYNTQNEQKPAYDFKLDVNNLSIQKAFQTFTLVKQFAPIAELVSGNVSTDLNISGLLNTDMMPVLNSTSGKGLLKIAQASIEDSKILNSLTSVTKLNDFDKVTLKNVVMNISIDDGKLGVKPFDINLGNYKTTVSGTTSLDGTLDYDLKLAMPAGKLGSQVTSLLGTGADEDGTIPVTIGLGGTYDNPKPRLLLDESGTVKEKATEEAREAAGDLLDNVKDERAKKVIGDVLDREDTASEDTTQQENLKEKVQEEAKDRIRDLFRKKKD